MDKQGLLNVTTVKVKDRWLGNALSLNDQGMQHDPGVSNGKAVQTIIPNNADFQTEDLDTYDSDCDDISNAQAVLMANISNFGSNVISELQTSHPYTDQSATSLVKIEAPRELPKTRSCLKLKRKKLENERLLEHIFCQDVVNIVMHADIKSDNVLPVQNTFLDDNIALDVLKMENDHSMELLVSQDLVHTTVNSLAVINDYKCMERSYIEEYERNLKLAAELLQMSELLKTCSRLKQQCMSLELKLQHNKRNFQNDKPCENQDAPIFREFFIINELKAQLQAKDTIISNLKKHMQELKGKSIVDCRKTVNKPKLIAPVVYKLDLEPLSSNLKNNREAHVDYIRITK
nr:hypothetical protein [Tanacetum cinerariifolium]